VILQQVAPIMQSNTGIFDREIEKYAQSKMLSFVSEYEEYKE
jgi:hypothetical protein